MPSLRRIPVCLVSFALVLLQSTVFSADGADWTIVASGVIPRSAE
ncbi:MAG: hypothetical protein QGG54_06930 [Gammaproteobacteria bacterium]|nr:hypothetical protein [Gammaproteobacteria bacterium]MDP6535859.1 hypothetical protein [Gammaproteobacteria bacterium]MDP6731248.1 hypothetical protein [Gammaproteobacteria bacterium]